jgi:hypothetical protein
MELHGQAEAVARNRSSYCSKYPNSSYVGRVLRLTLLAPDIIETIIDGRQPAEMTLAVLMRPFAVEWTEQRQTNFCWKMKRR